MAEDDRDDVQRVPGASLAALIIFIGFNLTFFPQFILGYLGMPRRYHVYPDEFQVLNVLSTAGASILGVGYLLPIFYLDVGHAIRQTLPVRIRGVRSVSSGRPPSPPPTFNFDRGPPVVTERVRLLRPERQARTKQETVSA